MRKFYYITCCIFSLLQLQTTGQTRSSILPTLPSKNLAHKIPNAFFNGMTCVPDSIHGYGFLSPTDSILGQRQLYKKYGATATAIYVYEGPQLSTIDSTVFDASGRPVFNELWEFNEDSNALVIEERTFYYPHAGAVQLDYFFAESILKAVEPNLIGNQPFDSVILYTKDFFTGIMTPEEKTVYKFSPSGQLQTVQIWNWDAFSSMSWYQASSRNYFYTPSGRTDYVDEYIWNGINLVHEIKAEYTYDANDSLILLLTTNLVTGLPNEKMEMTYDVANKTSLANFYQWDVANQQWVQTLKLFGDYDAQDRLEALEFVLNFLGSVDGVRYEYVYLGNSQCPFYLKVYENLGNGNWSFLGKFYYFPQFISSTEEVLALEWSAYPNPTKEGIWVQAPKGTLLQIITLQGVVFYRGQASGFQEFTDLKQSPDQVWLTVGTGNAAKSKLILVHH